MNVDLALLVVVAHRDDERLAIHYEADVRDHAALQDRLGLVWDSTLRMSANAGPLGDLHHQHLKLTEFPEASTRVDRRTEPILTHSVQLLARGQRRRPTIARLDAALSRGPQGERDD